MKIKVCGLKVAHNIEEVAALQPDYMGFIFYEKSARYLNSTMPEIQKEIQKIGVFVNETSQNKIQTHAKL